MTQWTPQARDAARERIGAATTAIGILAVGAAGAASILAWHATAEASAATKQQGGSVQLRPSGDDHDRDEDDHDRDDDGQGGDQGQGGAWSGISGGNGLPGGGIPGAPPPGQGSGGGPVRSQGS